MIRRQRRFSETTIAGLLSAAVIVSLFALEVVRWGPGADDLREEASKMPSVNRYTIPRVIAGVLALVASPRAAMAVYGTFRGEFDPILAMFALCTTLFVVLCAWFALRGNLPASRERLKRALQGGLVLGAIGFAVGFFGPLIWAPEANQGPLLGIFITGPVGFVVGSVLGWFVSPARARTITPSRT